MRILSTTLVPVLVALHACAIRLTLTTSSTYTLGLSGKALAHASSSAPTVSAVTIDSAAKNQVWSVLVAHAADDAETATVQNVDTLAFMAPSGASVVAQQSSFAWDLLVGAHNLFCHGVDGPCISVGSSGAVALAPQNFSDPIQQVGVTPVPPPAGAYALLNEANRVLLAGGTPLPDSVSFVPFPPANLEKSIWLVEPVAANPTQLVLTNLDTGAPLRADGANLSVAFPEFEWSSGFGQNVGTILSAPAGLLSGAGQAPSLNDTRFPDANVGWVFLPVL